MAENHIQSLYNALKDKYNLGSYEYFSDSLQDKEKRKKFYDALSKKYNLGTYDYFEELVGLYYDSFYDSMMSFFGVEGFPRTKTDIEKTRKVREFYSKLFSEESIKNPPSEEEAKEVGRIAQEVALKQKPGVVGEYLIGVMGGLTGSLSNIPAEQPPEPGFLTEVARGAGQFTGFLLGPGKIISLFMESYVLGAKYIPSLFKWVASKYGPAAPRWVNEAATLGLAFAISENESLKEVIEDPSFGSVMEHLANRAVAFVGGAVTGGRFGIIRDKIGSYVARAAVNLAITNITNLVLSEASGAELKLSDIVFSSLLDVWFSKRGSMPNEKELLELEKLAELMANDPEFKGYATELADAAKDAKTPKEKVKRVKKVVEKKVKDIEEELPEGVEAPEPPPVEKIKSKIKSKEEAPKEKKKGETGAKEKVKAKEKPGKKAKAKEEPEKEQVPKAPEEPQVAIKLKDGSIIKGDKNVGIVTHAQLATKYNIDPENIADTGWSYGGEYVSYKPKETTKKKPVGKPAEKAKEPTRTKKEIIDEFEKLRQENIKLHAKIHVEADPAKKKELISEMQELVSKKGKLKMELEETTGKRYVDLGWKLLEMKELTEVMGKGAGTKEKGKEKEPDITIEREPEVRMINKDGQDRFVVSHAVEDKRGRGMKIVSSIFDTEQQADKFAKILSKKKVTDPNEFIRLAEVIRKEPVVKPEKPSKREPKKSTKKEPIEIVEEEAAKARKEIDEVATEEVAPKTLPAMEETAITPEKPPIEEQVSDFLVGKTKKRPVIEIGAEEIVPEAPEKPTKPKTITKGRSKEERKAIKKAILSGEPVYEEQLDKYPDLKAIAKKNKVNIIKSEEKIKEKAKPKPGVKSKKRKGVKSKVTKPKTVKAEEVPPEAVVKGRKGKKVELVDETVEKAKTPQEKQRLIKRKVDSLKKGDEINTVAFGRVWVIDPNPRLKGKKEHIIAVTKDGMEVVLHKPTLGNEVVVYSEIKGDKLRLPNGEEIHIDRGADNLNFSDPSPGALGFIAGKISKNTKKLWQRFRAQVLKDPDAKNVLEMYERAEALSKEIHGLSLKRLKKLLVRRFIDTSGNLKRALEKFGNAGLKVIIKHDLIAGARSKAIKLYNDKFNIIYKDLSEIEVKVLNMIISSRRTLAISKYKEIAHPEGLVNEHEKFLDRIPKRLMRKLNKRADEYFKTMREMLDLLKSEGLLSDESYKGLVSKGDYSPRVVLHHIDPDIVYRSGFGEGRLITVSSSGLMPLEEGTYGLLEIDSQLLLNQVITRTITRIDRNRAAVELYNFAKENPDNGIARIWKRRGKVPARHTRVNAIVDGKVKSIIMPNEYAKEWVLRDPQISRELATAMKWISGSIILKPMATGINPEFILTNFPRDIMHIWLTTAEYSKFMPLAVLQMGRDLVKVAPDALFRKGRFLDYIDEGGGMEFLTHQGRITNRVSGALSELQQFLGYLGETSEIWTRLALRERAIRNKLKEGMPKEEAQTYGTWVARNYLDFSQGGSFAKAADNFVPYLNATIQGTRGILRYARQDPVKFTFKVSQLIALGASMYLANRVNEEAWDETEDFVKINYFFINLFPFTDKEGMKRWIQISIAKDQGQKFFTTIGEAMMALFLGDEKYNYNNILTSLKDALPLLPTENLPPTIALAVGYLANKDLWRMRDIWVGPKVQPEEEWREYTHPAFRDIGKVIGLSPERTKFALSKLFTYRNIYTSATGVLYRMITGQLDESFKEKVNTQLFAELPFVRKLTKVTDPRVRMRGYKDKPGIEIETERFKLTREFDTVLKRYFNDEATEDDIIEVIRKAPPLERDRLKQRFERALKINVIGNRMFWLDLADASPELRAYIFWAEYMRKDEKGRKELLEGLKIVPGIRSKKFDTHLAKLMKMSQEKGEWK